MADVRATKQGAATAGWLVCILGPERGRDYTLRTGENVLYKGQSGTKATRITYDDEHKEFYFTPGMTREIDYLNQAPVFTTARMHSGDLLETGGNLWRFIALCGGNFDWKEWQ